MRAKRGFEGLICGAGMFFLFLAALMLILHAVGTDARLYFRLQMKADILPQAGISQTQLLELDESLAAYLSGDASALDAAPFNERERVHMADCYDLFVLLRRAAATACALAAALLGCSIALLRTKRLHRAALGGAAGLMALILALGLWGLVDFDTLFTAFHRLLFTNDLWLLDPRTDLLIRICPQSMFSAMAAIIAAGELGFILLVNLLLRALPAAFGRHK